MPRGDGTGPNGFGPMTGRAAGYCAGYSVPGYANSVPGGRGFGAFGRGRGNRNMYYATGLTGWQRANPGYPVNSGYGGVSYMPPQPEMSGADERDMLNRNIEAMQAQLQEAQNQLADLEKE